MKKIFKEILKIKNAEELNAVIKAVNEQAKIVRAAETAKAKVGLTVGDTVIIKGKKTNGLKGVISKMKIKRAIVRCKNDQGETVLWDCPFTILEVA